MEEATSSYFWPWDSCGKRKLRQHRRKWYLLYLNFSLKCWGPQSLLIPPFLPHVLTSYATINPWKHYCVFAHTYTPSSSKRKQSKIFSATLAFSVCFHLSIYTDAFSHENAYRIYSNKRRGAYLIFRATNAALIRGRRLFKNCTR